MHLKVHEQSDLSLYRTLFIIKIHSQCDLNKNANGFKFILVTQGIILNH